MTWQLRRACLTPRCPGIAQDGCKGRCDACWQVYQRRRDRLRGTATQRGYDAAYRRRRAKAFRASKGLCVRCLAEGRYRPAAEGHHVVPLRAYGKDSPIEPLCRDHHTETFRRSSHPGRV